MECPRASPLSRRGRRFGYLDSETGPSQGRDRALAGEDVASASLAMLSFWLLLLRDELALAAP